MAYLEDYADRVRAVLVNTPNVIEQKMFGSLGFMVNGHLTIGIGDGKDGSVIMVRVGKNVEEELLKIPGSSISVMGKKTMHGWLDLMPEAVESDKSLQLWVNHALSFVQSLPPKSK